MSSLMATLAPALILSFLHQWAAYVYPGQYFARKYWLSFADGISITYIFLQLLPEITHLAAQASAPDKTIPSGMSAAAATFSELGRQHPFLPLLIGFTLFYGMEKWIARTAEPSAAAAQHVIHFRVHMVGLSLYKILLGYLLAHIGSSGGVLAFTVAMLMHFLVVDFHLLEMHQTAYRKVGRWILTGAFLAGWLASAAVAIPPLMLAMLISFVSGGAVLMIIQDEFSETYPSSFSSFLLAVLFYGALLLSF